MVKAAKKTKKTSKTSANKLVEDIKKTTTKLFELMDIKVSFDISEDKDNNAILINIDKSDEAGLIIGKKGENLESIQNIISLFIKSKTDEWKRVLVNVADWREKQDERVKELALKVAERVRETSETQNLYNLNAAQRRIVHITLAEFPDIKTESVGEGNERYLKVMLSSESK